MPHITKITNKERRNTSKTEKLPQSLCCISNSTSGSAGVLWQYNLAIMNICCMSRCVLPICFSSSRGLFLMESTHLMISSSLSHNQNSFVFSFARSSNWLWWVVLHVRGFRCLHWWNYSHLASSWIGSLKSNKSSCNSQPHCTGCYCGIQQDQYDVSVSCTHLAFTSSHAPSESSDRVPSSRETSPINFTCFTSTFR